MKSYKVKLNIRSNNLLSLFKKMSGLYRKIYNLAMEFQYYRFIVCPWNRYVGYNLLRRAINVCKEEQFPYLKEVDGGIYYAAIATAQRSFKPAFNYNVDTIPYLSRKKDIMKFKTIGKVRVHHSYITIPKVGNVKLQEKGRLPLDKTYSNITFINEGDGWFISLEVDEEYTKTELTGAPVSLDFTKEGDILLNDKVIESPTKSKKYLKLKKRLKRFSRKLKRQTKANLKRMSPTRFIPVTTRNMKKTKKGLDKLKKVLYNTVNDTYKKLVCDVARTKPREFHILDESSVSYTRNGYLTRLMREANSKSLLNMMRKKMELIGADVHTLIGADVRSLGSSISTSLGSRDYICGGSRKYHTSAKADSVKQTPTIVGEQKKTKMGNQETSRSK